MRATQKQEALLGLRSPAAVVMQIPDGRIERALGNTRPPLINAHAGEDAAIAELAERIRERSAAIPRTRAPR